MDYPSQSGGLLIIMVGFGLFSKYTQGCGLFGRPPPPPPLPLTGSHFWHAPLDVNKW